MSDQEFWLLVFLAASSYHSMISILPSMVIVQTIEDRGLLSINRGHAILIALFPQVFVWMAFYALLCVVCGACGWAHKRLGLSKPLFKKEGRDG